MLVEFSLTCIFDHVWKRFFQFMVFTFLENALNLCIYTNPQVHSRRRFFWKSVSPKTKAVEKTLICFIKIQSGNIYDRIYKGDLEPFLYFAWFTVFLTVTSLQFCEKHLSHSVVLSVLPLLCNHGSLTQKFHKK